MNLFTQVIKEDIVNTEEIYPWRITVNKVIIQYEIKIVLSFAVIMIILLQVSNIRKKFARGSSLMAIVIARKIKVT